MILGATIIDGLIGWLEKRIPETDAEARKTAAAMVTLIEGLLVMGAVGHSSIADETAQILFSGV
ncbi:MAG: hypothetical protein EXR08_10095 [Alphaproteobacteria bacterium]|nr:hypothetical protein [Alphaproteobacteria bacterium]